MGLADARRLRDEAKKKLAEGVDPSLAKKRDQLAAKAAAENTFGVIADEFIESSNATSAQSPQSLKTNGC